MRLEKVPNINQTKIHIIKYKLHIPKLQWTKKIIILPQTQEMLD